MCVNTETKTIFEHPRRVVDQVPKVRRAEGLVKVGLEWFGHWFKKKSKKRRFNTHGIY